MNVDLKSPGVCNVVRKLKPITTFLHRFGHGLNNVKGIQSGLIWNKHVHQKLTTSFARATRTKVKSGFANDNRPF